MEIMYIEKKVGKLINPFLSGMTLTGWTVTIAAGVVVDIGMLISILF